MSLHSKFAANLRRKCANFGSIAEVCRGVGINRQQFNKYLAGNSIPNALTLRKICIFLDIQEQSLFFDEEASVINSNGGKELPGFSHGGLPGFFTSARKHFDFHVQDLPAGFYHCYFPLHNVPGMLVRSLVVIRQRGKQKDFVRLSVFPSSGKTSRPLAKGRHKGIIFANEKEVYFLGVNRYPPGQLSLMTLERSDGASNGFFTGMILTRGGKTLISSRFCLIYADQRQDIRKLLKALGIIHESDANLESVVMATLFSKSTT
jgi:transcriptional regulator with XRE-family HTH domain